MSAGPRVLLMRLSERTSSQGNAYLARWLGKASVVAFRGEPDKHGNPTWDLFVSTPEPKAEAGQERPPARAQDGPAKPSARPQERGDGWRARYVRPRDGARRAPAAEDGAFHEDSLEDIGR